MSLVTIYALFMDSYGRLVEVPGKVAADTAERMERREFMARGLFMVKHSSGKVVGVPLVVNSALTSKNHFQREVDEVLAYHYKDKLDTLCYHQLLDIRDWYNLDFELGTLNFPWLARLNIIGHLITNGANCCSPVFPHNTLPLCHAHQ